MDDTQGTIGPATADAITMLCVRCDARSSVAVTDVLKAETVRLFCAAHAGHGPTVLIGAHTERRG